MHLNLESSGRDIAHSMVRVKIEQERKEVDVLFCGCRSTKGPVGGELRKGRGVTLAYTAVQCSPTRANWPGTY